MRIDDFKLFLMVDDSDDELFLTKAIFQIAYPAIQFRCEKNPTQLVAHIGQATAAGIPAAQICVLLDIRMPRLNGFELIYELRNEIATYQACILMLSASRVLDDRDHSAAIGADGFVAKPFTVAKLQAALAACVGATQPA